jgi:hypothetical protein
MPSRCRYVTAERLTEKQLTQNQMFWQQIDGQPEAATEEPPGLHQLVHQRLRMTMDARRREPEDEARPRTNCR